jgi:hypothetical protein
MPLWTRIPDRQSAVQHAGKDHTGEGTPARRKSRNPSKNEAISAIRTREMDPLELIDLGFF